MFCRTSWISRGSVGDQLGPQLFQMGPMSRHGWCALFSALFGEVSSQPISPFRSLCPPYTLSVPWQWQRLASFPSGDINMCPNVCLHFATDFDCKDEESDFRLQSSHEDGLQCSVQQLAQSFAAQLQAQVVFSTRVITRKRNSKLEGRSPCCQNAMVGGHTILLARAMGSLFGAL